VVGRLFPRSVSGRTVIRDADRDDDKYAGRPGRVRIGRAGLRGCGVGMLLFRASLRKVGPPIATVRRTSSDEIRCGSAGVSGRINEPSDRSLDV
jgi:hypothetical protein